MQTRAAVRAYDVVLASLFPVAMNRIAPFPSSASYAMHTPPVRPSVPAPRATDPLPQRYEQRPSRLAVERVAEGELVRRAQRAHFAVVPRDSVVQVITLPTALLAADSATPPAPASAVVHAYVQNSTSLQAPGDKTGLIINTYA
jgi:hypothetical protein